MKDGTIDAGTATGSKAGNVVTGSTVYSALQGYASLSGATFTGDISGANATFSDTLTADTLTDGTVTITGGKISGLAEGTADTDAVNKGQLDAALEGLSTYTAGNGISITGNTTAKTLNVNANSDFSL